MNCEQAQQEILLSDDPGAAATRPEIAGHVQSCALCQAMVRQLTKLESAAKVLPVKGDSAERPLPLVTERMVLAARPQKRAGCMQWVSRTAAAIFVIVFGLIGITMTMSAKPARAEVVYGDLVAWNLRISQADSKMRDQLYHQKLNDMKKEVDSLSAADRALAEKLLRNAESMANGNDPVAETTHFQEIAEQLKARQKALADKAAAAQMEALYSDVVRQGIELEIKRVDVQTLPDVQRQEFEESQKWMQQHALPSSLPAIGPSAMIPVQGLVPGSYGAATESPQIHVGVYGSGSAGTPVLPSGNPLHDFMPIRPFAWTPPTAQVVVIASGNGGDSHGGSKSAGAPASSSVPPAAAGSAADSTDGRDSSTSGSTTGASCENLPPITQAAGGSPRGSSGLGDLPDPGDFDSGTAGAGVADHHGHGDMDSDWSLGSKPSDYADGALPGWMKFWGGAGGDGSDGAGGRHVADQVPLPNGCMDDAGVVRNPDGSTLPDEIRHSQAVSGFVDFGGSGIDTQGAGTATTGALASPEPAAGLLLGLGMIALLRRRRAALPQG